MLPYAEGSAYRRYEEEKEADIKWRDKILLNRPSKVVLIGVLSAIALPLLLYNLFFVSNLEWQPRDGHSLGTCLILRTLRLPCGPGNVSQNECHPQCCYDMDANFCFHRFPPRFSFILNQPWNEEAILRPRVPVVPYASQNSVPNLRLSIDEISSTHLSLTYYDPSVFSLEGRRIDSKAYEYEVTTPELNVLVRAAQGTIFNTGRGPLIASENIWEIAFDLSNETLYGLGELPLKPGTVKVLYNHDGGLSSIPLIYAKFNESYHGLLIDMQAPTEIHVQHNNTIIIRSITNWGLKLHLFVGPEPKNIMNDVIAYLGRAKKLEYWMLGVHICSENLHDDDSDSLADLQVFIANATSNRVSYESHCGIKPIVFKAEKDNEEIAAIEAGAEAVRTAGKKLIPHVSPYIQFVIEEEEGSTTEGINFETTTMISETSETSTYDSSTYDSSTSSTLERSTPESTVNLVYDFHEFMFKLNRTGEHELYYGIVSSDSEETVAYPDYEAVDDEFLDKLWTFNMEIDGLVLENTWPLDNSLKMHEETSEMLPYFSKEFKIAFNSTPQWNMTRPQGGRYIYEHNKYSNNFIDAMNKISSDAPMWSTNQWMKTDVLINRQNIDISWSNLNKELVEAALGGISGHWLWSSPVCGDTAVFNMETQVNLCVKWYMTAAYLPMIKIHSNTINRHPLAFSGTHRNLILSAMRKRLSLLPYYYTVLQEGPLLRPMFYQFPNSEDLSDLSNQFSVGDDLIIAPNLFTGQSNVHIHMPPGTWYELTSGLKIDVEEGGIFTMTTREADFLTFVRGGSIIVLQNDVTTSAEETRKASQYSLIVSTEAQNITEKMVTELRAEGKLFISENMTIHFKLTGADLVITTDAELEDFEPLCGIDATWANIIKEIKIYGLGDDENNYDHHKQINTPIDLCELENKDVIVFPIVT